MCHLGTWQWKLTRHSGFSPFAAAGQVWYLCHRIRPWSWRVCPLAKGGCAQEERNHPGCDLAWLGRGQRTAPGNCLYPGMNSHTSPFACAQKLWEWIVRVLLLPFLRETSPFVSVMFSSEQRHELRGTPLFQFKCSSHRWFHMYCSLSQPGLWPWLYSFCGFSPAAAHTWDSPGVNDGGTGVFLKSFAGV